MSFQNGVVHDAVQKSSDNRCKKEQAHERGITSDGDSMQCALMHFDYEYDVLQTMNPCLYFIRHTNTHAACMHWHKIFARNHWIYLRLAMRNVTWRAFCVGKKICDTHTHTHSHANKVCMHAKLMMMMTKTYSVHSSQTARPSFSVMLDTRHPKKQTKQLRLT